MEQLDPLGRAETEGQVEHVYSCEMPEFTVVEISSFLTKIGNLC